MLKDKRLSAVAGLALTLGICLGQPAKAANEALDYLQQYFGGVNNTVNYGEAQRLASLDADRAEVEDRVSRALGAGRITAWQASQFDAQLRSNKTLAINLVADGRFTFSDQDRVATELSGINVRLQNAISSNIAVNPRPGWVGHFPPRGFVTRKQVDDLQNQLTMRLQRGLSSGRLTNSEYHTLRQDMNEINARKMQMISNRGFLTFSDNQRLLSRLNRLRDQMRVEMNDSQIAGREEIWY